MFHSYGDSDGGDGDGNYGDGDVNDGDSHGNDGGGDGDGDGFCDCDIIDLGCRDERPVEAHEEALPAEGVDDHGVVHLRDNNI